VLRTIDWQAEHPVALNDGVPSEEKTRRALFRTPPQKVRPLPSTIPPLTPLGNRTRKKRHLPQATHLRKGAANRKKSSSTLTCLFGRKKGMERYCSEVRRLDPQDFKASNPILIRGSKVGPQKGSKTAPAA
jgi:hypothetical protein